MEQTEGVCQRLVKATLAQVDDKFLAEDIDLLCQYIVARFLSTSSTVVTGADEETVVTALGEFLEDRFTFIMTFVTVLNSEPATVRTEA
jgi:hypothetical protein